MRNKIAESGLDIHKAMVKVGLDGGQGSLKVAATIEECEKEDDDKKRSSYEDVSLNLNI